MFFVDVIIIAKCKKLNSRTQLLGAASLPGPKLLECQRTHFTV